MYSYQRPQCRRQEMVRAETIVKAGNTSVEPIRDGCTLSWNAVSPSPVTDPTVTRDPHE